MTFVAASPRLEIMRVWIRFTWVMAWVAASFAPLAYSIEKQPAAVYHARRVALSAKLHGGVAVLFAAEEPVLDLMPYRQDPDFYYLTGWNEPGAALLIVAASAGGRYPWKVRSSCSMWIP